MKLKTFEELKTDFNKRLEKITHKKVLIENEIQEVEIYVRNEQVHISGGNKGGSIFSAPSATRHSYGSRVFELDIVFTGRDYLSEAFLKYLYEDDKTAYEDREHPYYKERILAIEQSYEFAEYYVWLKELLEKPNLLIVNTKSNLSNAQKVLALHYLGIDYTQTSNIKYSKVLSKILGIGGENIRQNISKMHSAHNGIITEDNLKSILELFDEYKISEAKDKIKKDLSKLD